jgi:flagellar export protein FliJ
MPDEDRYRAAPVRDERARSERIKKTELAAAVGATREAEARLAAAREALAAAVATADAQPTAARRVLAERHAQALRRRVADLADALARASGQLDAKQRQLAHARAQREVIERHFERWRQDRRKLADRRED